MDKWQGSFAQTQLEKFGWETGEGLGKNKHGNVKHINVTVKNDKKGVGVNQGQWEFAWWDHLYNKSASSVVVAKDEEKGQIKVQTKSKGETRRSKTGIISTQKPTGKSITETTTNSTMSSMADERNMMDSVNDIHASMAKRVASASLYGAFVKSSTPVDISNTNSPAASTPVSSAEDSEDDELKDYSIKVSDADLFAACEGRTARKGGRGLVDQKGKFKRVMKEYLRPEEDPDVVAVKKDTKKDEKKSKKRKHTDEEDDKKSKKSKKEKKEKKEKKDKKEKKEKKEKKDKKDKKDKKKKSKA